MSKRVINQHELQPFVEYMFNNKLKGYGLMIHREIEFGTIELIKESIKGLGVPSHFIDVTLLSINELIGASNNVLEDLVADKFEDGGIIVFESFDGATTDILRRIFVFLDRAPRNILFIFTVKKDGIYLPSHFLNRVSHLEYEMVLPDERLNKSI